MGARFVPMALAALVVFSAAPASAAPVFCKPSDKPCTRVTVPIDRSGAVPGVLNLQVERRKARRPTRPPLMLLAGGPGQSATRSFSVRGITALLGREARARDVYVLDQRGTGRSGAIACTPLQRAVAFERAVVERCANALGARRGFFQTRDSVEDIDDVRRALGLSKIALVGTSYGTRVAEAYAVAHPDRVDRLVLNSVVPPDGVSQLGLDFLGASPRLVRGICSGRCRGFTRDPVADMRRLSTRLARRPLEARFVNSRGRARTVKVTLEDLVGVFLAGDFVPGLRTELPGAVRAALDGDPAPLARVVLSGEEEGALPDTLLDFSVGTFVATTCEETPAPWPASATSSSARLGATRRVLASLPAAAFGAFTRNAALVAGPVEPCARWPLSGRAPEPAVPARLPAVPTLVMAGGRDGRTPLEGARSLAARIPGSQLLVADLVGHDVIGQDPSGCARKGLRTFLAGGRAPARCAEGPDPRPPAPPPASLRQVRPAAGISGRSGRTANAVRFTVRSLNDELVGGLLVEVAQSLRGADPSGEVQVGGLRGGTAVVSRNGDLVTMRRISEIPGVVVSGSYRANGKGVSRLRVGGDAASRGSLTVRGGVARGRLGGQTVRFGLGLSLDAALERSAGGAAAARAAALLGRR